MDSDEWKGMGRFSYPKKKGTNCMKPYKAARQTEDSDSRGQKRLVPPPELRGKAIGLWYRDQNRRRRAEQNPDDPSSQRIRDKRKKKIVMSVKLDTKKQEEIEEMLEAVSAHRPYARDIEYRCAEFQKSFLNKINVNFEEKLEEMTYFKPPSDPRLNEELYKDMLSKMDRPQYKSMLEFRQKLPSYNKKNEILKAIKENQIVLISGETGCGKSTQIVQYVFDDHIWNKEGSLCNIICTQPRRISAISVAERVAAERAEKIGDSIGYVIRLEHEVPKRKQGLITFVTTGVLIQYLQSDPVLSRVSHLFIDEIHERDTICDFLLTLLKYILPKRPDLRVILMSATLNAQNFSDYFGGIPMIEIPGFTYPVEEIYLEQILQKVRFTFPKFGKNRKADSKTFKEIILPYIQDLENSGFFPKAVTNELKNPQSESLNLFLMADVVEYICKHEPDGAILVFVPGLAEIQDLVKTLNCSSFFSPSQHLLIPMHSIMPTVNQREAFVKPPPGVRKIVIATNIAETSITIDDIVYVVDGGRIKMQNFDLKKNVVTLEPEWETKANAKQRRGRAGRTQPGKCYKLFTKAREDVFESFPIPEMQRTRLEEVILNAKTLQLGRIGPFLMKVMDPPDPKAVELSLKLLQTINALDSEERLTPLGFHLAKLPMDPQTGKMIIMGALFSCIDPILSIAACLNFKDPFVFVLGKEHLIQERRIKLSRGGKSDHFMLSEVMREWEACEGPQKRDFAHKNFLSHQNLMLLRSMKRQFANHLKEMDFLASNDPKFPSSNINSDNVGLIKAIVCSGLYPNVAMIKRVIKKRNTGVPSRIIWYTKDHSRVSFHSKSILDKEKQFESPFVVYFQKMKTASVLLHDATMVYPMALLFFGARLDFIKENKKPGIKVDELIQFGCSQRTSMLVKRLRSHLLDILESTVSNPSVVNWEVDNMRTILLKAIVELITTEDKSLEEYIDYVQQENDECSDEDDD